MSKKRKDKIIKELNDKIKEYEVEIDKLINERKCNQKKIHNERRAGRKPKFSKSKIELIKKYRKDGNTIKDIAQMCECSVGLIYKLIQ